MSMDSGSESGGEDDGFQNDMEALRKACLLVGRSPNDLQQSDSDDDEDFELARKIQARFIDNQNHQPLTMKPICFIPPPSSSTDDYEDDLETLRAIQRRFTQYNDSTNNTFEGSSKQVGATNIDSQKETSNNLFVESTNNGEGFPDYVDASAVTQSSEPLCNLPDIPTPSNPIESSDCGGEIVEIAPVGDSTFPKSGQAFVDAIKKNRACQKFIRNKMVQIEARLEENKKLRARVKILKDFQLTCRRRTGRALSQKKDPRIELISLPKQRTNSKFKEKNLPAFLQGPSENPHVAKYRKALENYPLSFNRENWSKQEKENLLKGIRQQFQEMLLQKALDVFSVADGDSNDFDSMMASVRSHDISFEDIRSFLPKVNWDELASMYVIGRTGAECEARWINWEDPLINHQQWTRLEDKKLLHIIQQRGISNWIDVAVTLGRSRTPFQCLARYQRSLNVSILKREWSEDDDNELRAAVAAIGESNWQLVASKLQGRTGTQCSNRWKKSLNPVRQIVGRWTLDEDRRLKISVMLFGAKNWNKISQFVPGRTQVQCRERWVNCLDPSLNLNEWTEEEDSKLKAAITEYGYSWSKVAACVPPRTDSQCRRRWKVLLPDEVPLLQAARKMQKAALISNFVDREEERPALGPGDFLPLATIEPGTGSENIKCSKAKRRKSRPVMEQIENDGSSGCVRRKRSRRTRKESQNDSNRVLRLIDEDDDENFCVDGNDKLAATSHDLPLHPDADSLAVTNSQEPGDCSLEKGISKKKASGRRKRKLRTRDTCNGKGTSELDTILKLNQVQPGSIRNKTGAILEQNEVAPRSCHDQLLCQDTDSLPITNSHEVGDNSLGNANSKKQSSGRRKRKSRTREVCNKKGTSEFDPILELNQVQPSTTRNEQDATFEQNEVQPGFCGFVPEPNCFEVAEFGPEYLQTVSEVNEPIGHDDPSMEKVWELLPCGGSDPTVEHSSDINSTALVELREVEEHPIIPRNTSQDLSSVDQNLALFTEDLEAGLMPGELIEASGNAGPVFCDKRLPRCSTPDIVDSWNSKTLCSFRPNRIKKGSSGGRGFSKRISETVDDDTTLAAFLQQFREGSKSTGNDPFQISRVENDVTTLASFRHKGRKRTGNDSFQISGVDDDMTTLASFQRKGRGSTGNDSFQISGVEDDMSTLANFLRKGRKRKARCP